MSYVFGKNTSMWFRLKIWTIVLFQHFMSLPSYINPKQLRPNPLTEVERKEFEALEEIE